jgi:hypothetical protein
VLVVRGDDVECVVGESEKPLEGKEVWTGGDDGEKRTLKKLEVKTPTCRRGLRLQTVRVNGTEKQVFGVLLSTATPYSFQDNVTGDIELRGGNDGQGNVYTTINGSKKPVCDNDWDDADAGVVCRWPAQPAPPARMLGYAGGRATRDFGIDNVLRQLSAIEGKALLVSTACMGWRKTCWTAALSAAMTVGRMRPSGPTGDKPVGLIQATFRPVAENELPTAASQGLQRSQPRWLR